MRKRNIIEDMQQLAIERGGKCLSEAYVNSHTKMRWQCKEGHQWLATACNIKKGTWCPYCVNQAVCKDNCLRTVNPALAREWHPKKNKGLTAKDVTAGTIRKVWWICKRKHEWQANVNNRNRGAGCPYCAGRAVCKDNCLQTVNPALAREWHPKKNKGLTAKDVTAGTVRKVWWLCSKGHEWESSISNRSRGRGCPYCAGKA